MQRFPLVLALSALSRPFRVASACALALVASSCIVHHDHGPPGIQFEETLNLGYACGGPLTSWTVFARETAEQGTAGCEQPILFLNLAPNTFYTFDITGFSGSRLCWQGTCQVNSGDDGRVFPNCSAQIAHLCGI